MSHVRVTVLDGSESSVSAGVKIEKELQYQDHRHELKAVRNRLLN